MSKKQFGHLDSCACFGCRSLPTDDERAAEEWIKSLNVRGYGDDDSELFDRFQVRLTYLAGLKRRDEQIEKLKSQLNSATQAIGHLRSVMSHALSCTSGYEDE